MVANARTPGSLLLLGVGGSFSTPLSMLPALVTAPSLQEFTFVSLMAGPLPVVSLTFAWKLPHPGAWGKRASPLPFAPGLSLIGGMGWPRGLLGQPGVRWGVRWGGTDWPLLLPYPCGWKMPPPLVPGLRKPHTLTSHSLPRRSFVFFPSRGFLWGWALWGYSFLLGRGRALGKGPSSAFCPSEPL